MNNVCLIGRITKDPTLRYTGGENLAVCRFTLAIDDGYGEKKRTSFIPIIVFGKSAENCDRYLHKGDRAGVSGKIQTGSYEKDGRKVYTTDVVANMIYFFFESSESQKEEAPKGFEALDSDIPF